jgi:hypothetical protein
MSFGKLLAAGKSFAGGKDAFRYRVDPRAVLPKFISPKNPFSQLPNKDATAPAVTPAAPVPCLPNQATDVGARAASSSSLEMAAARASAWKRIAGWGMMVVRRLNPLKLLKRAAAAPKSAIPRFGKPAVQAEFPLDQVRVARNDLSDADLEIVAAGKRPVAKNETDEGAWGRLATRVFGTETM